MPDDEKEFEEIEIYGEPNKIIIEIDEDVE